MSQGPAGLPPISTGLREEDIGQWLPGPPPPLRRPGVAESVRLLRGAVRARVRSFLDGAPTSAWQDARAVTSVVLPLFLLLEGFTLLVIGWRELGQFAPTQIMLEPMFFVSASGRVLVPLTLSLREVSILALEIICGIMPPLILGVLVVRRRRAAAVRLGALLVLSPVVGIAASLLLRHYYFTTSLVLTPQGLGLLCALGVETMVVFRSEGPRRGLRVVTWRHGAMLAIAAAAVAAANSRWWLSPARDEVPREYALIGVFVVIMLVMALSSPVSRRVMLLLYPPVAYLTAPFFFHPLRYLPALSPPFLFFAAALVAVPVLLVIALTLRSAARALTRGRREPQGLMSADS